MASNRESNRPLFHRFANREAINFKSSEGKRLRDGNNILVFAGELALNNPLGTFWPDYVQAGALVLMVGEDAEIGGYDRVKISADGNTIDLDPSFAWISTGGAIDPSPGATNIIQCKMVSSTEIEYSVLN